MRKLLLLADLFLCVGWAFGQTVYVYPATVSVPVGSYQPCSAVVNGVNNKTVTWTTNHGTLIGPNPSTVNGTAAIAVHDTSAETVTVTATTNTGAITGTCTVTFTAAPTPLTTNPRFLFTQANLAAQQAKATGGNVFYTAVLGNGNYYFSQVNTIWSWTCLGGTGMPSSSQLGNYGLNAAYALTFMAMIQPAGVPTGGSCTWGQYARDVTIAIMNEYTTAQWFGSPGNWNQQNLNEWSDTSYAAPVGDWLIGIGAVTTTGDKNSLRAFYAYMEQVVLNFQGTPAPGTYNAPATLVRSPPTAYDLTGMRAAGNNYNLSRMVWMVAGAFTWNDNTTDDPPLTNTCSATRYQVCPDFTAGSLAAYGDYFFGATLYMYYAAVENPAVVQAVYNAVYSNMSTPPQCDNTDGNSYNCLGINSEGESTEGSWYQESMFRAVLAFNMLRTAGLLNPLGTSGSGLVYGPQVAAASSSYWDLKYVSDLQFLTAYPSVTVSGATQAAAYYYLPTGDTYQAWRSISDAETESQLLLSDSETGRTDRTNPLLWMQLNFAGGGPKAPYQGGCVSECGYDYQIGNANYSGYTMYEMYLSQPAGDPVATLPPSPFSSLPADLYNNSLNQHFMAWNRSSPATLFTYWWNNSLYNHEYNFDGGFDLVVGGEYVTKRRTIFNDYNPGMLTYSNQNQMGLINSNGMGGATCNFATMLLNGGQLPEGDQNGMVTPLHSELPIYVAANADITAAYNGQSTGVSCGAFPSYSDITAASRSMVYLRSAGQIIYYDRAAVGHSASTQTLYQGTTGTTTVSGSTATWLTRSGATKGAFTSLLPSGATVTASFVANALTTSGPSGSLNVQQGTNVQLVATGTNGPATATVTSTPYTTWESYVPSTTTPCPYATISSTGLVTAVSAGTCTIATFYKGIAAYGNLTVVTGSSSGTFAGNNSSDTYQLQDWEPYDQISVTPSGTPTSTQFLSLLQWGPSSFTPATATLVNSTAGKTFQGTVLGDSLVMFSQTYPICNTFTSTAFPASSASTIYVSDLCANTTYTVTGAGTPSTVTTDTAGVAEFSASGTGIISLTPGGTPIASTPTFSPVGGTYASTQSVTLSTASSGAIICYNTTGSPATNGASGCTTGTLYSGAISVSTSETLYAVAGGTGYVDSPVGSAAYIITAATPTFSPAAGTYLGTQSVTISTVTSGATICYTTDGSTPTAVTPGTCTNGTTYSTPVAVAVSETLNAIATKSGLVNSGVGTAVYVINGAAAPTFSPPAGTYTGTQSVTLSTTTSACSSYQVYNTTGASSGGNLTGTTAYTTPISVSSTSTIYAQVQSCPSIANSTISSAAYTINVPSPTQVTVEGTITIEPNTTLP